MPIFPHDDSSPDEDQQFSFEISRVPEGLVIGVREFWSIYLSGVDDIKVMKGDYSFGPARVRSSVGGGFYPFTHLAITKLQPLLVEAKFWGERSPFYIEHDGDVWMSCDRRSRDEHISAPYIIANQQLEVHTKVARAVEVVLDAMRMEAETALRVWSRTPCPWVFRAEAERGIRDFIASRPLNEIATQRKLLRLPARTRKHVGMSRWKKPNACES
jgi:hypothetical protein